MPLHSRLPPARRFSRFCALAAIAALAGCTLLPKPDAPGGAEGPGDPAAAPGTPGTPDIPTVRLITAQTPAVRAWRKQGAQHLYKIYAKKIYKGKIPPLVYAVVVVETDIDAQGNVTQVTYSRTPSHAPEVPPQIAQMIRAASPFPAPGKVGPHTYVDTWLWDKSGRFQLDTLTEGQRSR
ncbi:hypothetical protein [Xenophilus sp. Marseille-Q4582]|uniref:hypothetical protein n=1 Tax=Xenophilus sp. Marseille-Q4582 TaxID=2866600 RepID=UPI001CE43568|nr:hypothetical protein [Xenophilus sp. Marseille-Q4582]